MVRRDELGQGPLEDRILEIFRTNKCRTVDELVKAIEKHDRTISISEIKDAIESLRDARVFILAEPPVEGNLVSYLKANYIGAFPFWMALIASTLTLALTYLLVAPTARNQVLDVIRIAAGSATVLIIPGYGLSNLLFPKREHEERNSTIMHLGIGFGLNFALLPILWLVLLQSPSYLRLDFIVVSMSVAGILLNLGALYRRFSVRRKRVILVSIPPSTMDPSSTIASGTSTAFPTSRTDQP